MFCFSDLSFCNHKEFDELRAKFDSLQRTLDAILGELRAAQRQEAVPHQLQAVADPAHAPAPAHVPAPAHAPAPAHLPPPNRFQPGSTDDIAIIGDQHHSFSVRRREYMLIIERHNATPQNVVLKLISIAYPREILAYFNCTGGPVKVKKRSN